MLSSLLVATILAQAQPTINRALIESAVRPVLDEQRIPGVVVAVTRGDSVVLLEVFGVRDVATGAPLRANDLFLVGSITKQFTATLLAQLAERGALSLDDPVQKYLDRTGPLPDWTSLVTLRQLATHTSGVPREPVNRKDLPGSPSVMQPYSRAELYDGLRRTTLDAEPGARWSYSNLGYAILGEVIERASGQSYEALLRERVLTPLAMTNTGVTVTPSEERRFPSGYWPEDREPVARPRWVIGEVASFSGVHSSAGDLARFVAAQTSPAPGAALSAGLRRMLHTTDPDISVAPGRSMALSWFVESLPGGLRVIGGGGEVDSFSGAIAFLEHPRAGIVVLTNRGGDSGERLMRAVMTRVLPALAGG
jgi:CubicO group peptidase (beta-lactamase class C family)